PIPGEACGGGYIIGTGDQYEVHAAVEETTGHYLPNVSCSLQFRTENYEAFFIRIIKFNVESSRSCENDALFLYDGVEDPEKLMTETTHGLCGESLSLPNYFTTTAGDLTIKFRTDYANEAGGFTMFVTPFSKNEECDGGFQCLKDKKCMTPDAKCNGANQCKDGSDEPKNCRL
ncbi:hypothetical protein BSL78_07607, partial [Apostichopus japonicus]